MLRRTSFAVSTDETRYVLNGIFFSFKDNKVTLVATRGADQAFIAIEHAEHGAMVAVIAETDDGAEQRVHAGGIAAAEEDCGEIIGE